MKSPGGSRAESRKHARLPGGSRAYLLKRSRMRRISKTMTHQMTEIQYFLHIPQLQFDDDWLFCRELCRLMILKFQISLQIQHHILIHYRFKSILDCRNAAVRQSPLQKEN